MHPVTLHDFLSKIFVSLTQFSINKTFLDYVCQVNLSFSPYKRFTQFWHLVYIFKIIIYLQVLTIKNDGIATAYFALLEPVSAHIASITFLSLSLTLQVEKSVRHWFTTDSEEYSPLALTLEELVRKDVSVIGTGKCKTSTAMKGLCQMFSLPTHTLFSLFLYSTSFSLHTTPTLILF